MKIYYIHIWTNYAKFLNLNELRAFWGIPLLNHHLGDLGWGRYNLHRYIMSWYQDTYMQWFFFRNLMMVYSLYKRLGKYNIHILVQTNVNTLDIIDIMILNLWFLQTIWNCISSCEYGHNDVALHGRILSYTIFLMLADTTWDFQSKNKCLADSLYIYMTIYADQAVLQRIRAICH